MSRDPEIRGIDAMLSLADGGQYLPVLTQEMRELIEETTSHAQAYRVKAKCKLALTVTMTIDPFGQIDMEVEHKLTEPKAPKAKALAWSTEGGGLTVANPNQRTMEIRDVAGGRRELRSPTLD
ncbi:hypothetical protein [Gemmobacter sp.]|uniref:hypothetical protein n=1 Tax=Gemmobacter sp. TaxID=1898957 RepID=UPI002B003457|nr:hypothetical protein [Gemmobacter sp.]